MGNEGKRIPLTRLERKKTWEATVRRSLYWYRKLLSLRTQERPSPALLLPYFPLLSPQGALQLGLLLLEIGGQHRQLTGDAASLAGLRGEQGAALCGTKERTEAAVTTGFI